MNSNQCSIIAYSVKWCAWGALLVLCTAGWSQPVQAASRTRAQCAAQFRQTKYLAAAACFVALAKALGPSTGLQGRKRQQKGGHLRNAALSYERAAQREKRVERAGHYRELAVALLDRYQKEKLYKNVVRLRSAIVLQTTIQKKLKYTPLTLIFGHKQARFVLRGYRLVRKGQGQHWSQNIRPGPYVLEITYPGKAKRKDRLTLRAGTPLIKTYRPPDRRRATPRLPRERLPKRPKATPHKRQRKIPPPRKLPALAWAGYLGGGALLLTGGILGVVGGMMRSSADSDWRNPSKAQQGIVERGQSGSNLLVSGIAIAAGGILFLGVGVLVHALAPSTPASAPKHTQRNTQQPPTHTGLLWRGESP